jgi:hypothetical protein
MAIATKLGTFNLETLEPNLTTWPKLIKIQEPTNINRYIWTLNITFAHSCWCNQYKSIVLIFFPPFVVCPISFHIAISKHVSNPCNTCFGHVMNDKVYVTCYKTLGTCYLACYVPLDTSNMGGYGCKTWQGEKE